MNNAVNLPFVPETVTVHLGRPNEAAQNVTLPFYDYIANVASSEIYPTWPEEAIRANILAQISYTLNRIYTEYYPARGYDFDITNSTSVDQSFVNGREIFDNINDIVGQIFDSYIRRDGNIEPLFAAYCDGVETQCNGLSQWGSVDLARAGDNYFEILENYYGNDIGIVDDVPIENITDSAPAVPLRVGVANDAVRAVQIRLNRIAANYPSIPRIAVEDGIFSFDTEEAVREFQRIFGLTADGVVGRATWYKTIQIYNAVKRLAELDAEGIELSEVTQQFPRVLRLGDSGVGVSNLQYYLNYLSSFYDTIRSVTIDGFFGENTEAAVRDLQQTFGITVDGVVGALTWNTMYNAYLGAIATVPPEYREGVVVPFPGVILRLGVDSEDVRLLQEYLNFISQYDPEIPSVSPTGYFGEATQSAVIAFQSQVGIPPSGVVAAPTWQAITDRYSDLYFSNRPSEGTFPGYTVGE